MRIQERWFRDGIARCNHSKPSAGEPTIDPFGDRLPSGLKHHVVAHVGEDFRLGAVRPRRLMYLGQPSLGPGFVASGSQDEKRCRDALGAASGESGAVEPSPSAGFLEPSSVAHYIGFRCVDREELLAGQLRCWPSTAIDSSGHDLEDNPPPSRRSFSQRMLYAVFPRGGEDASKTPAGHR